jgi:hypothetical protein
MEKAVNGKNNAHESTECRSDIAGTSHILCSNGPCHHPVSGGNKLLVLTATTETKFRIHCAFGAQPFEASLASPDCIAIGMVVAAHEFFEA